MPADIELTLFLAQGMADSLAARHALAPIVLTFGPGVTFRTRDMDSAPEILPGSLYAAVLRVSKPGEAPVFITDLRSREAAVSALERAGVPLVLAQGI
jgi:hypothetical protein